MALTISGVAWTEKAKKLTSGLTLRDFDWAVRTAYASLDDEMENHVAVQFQQESHGAPRQSTEHWRMLQARLEMQQNQFEKFLPEFSQKELDKHLNNPDHKALIDHLEEGIGYFCITPDDLKALRDGLQKELSSVARRKARGPRDHAAPTTPDASWER